MTSLALALAIGLRMAAPKHTPSLAPNWSVGIHEWQVIEDED